MGLTLYKTSYSVKDEAHSVHNMYTIEWNRIREEQEYATHEIFYPDTQPYGNNDFLELQSPDDDTYLYPHKTMTSDGLNSNGIWYTKARRTDPPEYILIKV